MNQLISANRENKRIQTKAFRALSLSNIKNFQEEVIPRQVESVLKHHFKLSPLDFEISDLPFDRFLLHCSSNYRATRERALAYGIQLKSRALSKAASVYFFETTHKEVYYSPLAEELYWTLTTKKMKSKERVERLQSLSQYTSVIFHDLNHFVFYCSLRPRRLKANFETCKNYFLLIESLAIFRDIELSKELGGLSVPLKAIGLLYESTDQEPQGTPPSLLEFKKSVLFMFLRLKGKRNKWIRDFFVKNSLGQVPFKVSKESQLFVDETIPGWFERYKEDGYYVRLPACKGPRLQLSNQSLSSWNLLLCDENFWKSLYGHYMGLFWPGLDN